MFSDFVYFSALGLSDHRTLSKFSGFKVHMTASILWNTALMTLNQLLHTRRHLAPTAKELPNTYFESRLNTQSLQFLFRNTIYSNKEWVWSLSVLCVCECAYNFPAEMCHSWHVSERGSAPVRSRSSLLFGPIGGINPILCSQINYGSVKVNEHALHIKTLPTGLSYTCYHYFFYIAVKQHYVFLILWDLQLCSLFCKRHIHVDPFFLGLSSLWWKTVFVFNWVKSAAKYYTNAQVCLPKNNTAVKWSPAAQHWPSSSFTINTTHNDVTALSACCI